MKSLSLVVLAVVSFGALALSGCSGCSQQDTNTNTSTSNVGNISCGPGTHRVGNQCVGNAASTTNRPATLNTTGNN